MPYHAAKFAENSLKQILKYKLWYKLSIILDHSWAKIVHLAQRRTFLKTPLKQVFSSYCNLSFCKAWKKYFTLDPVTEDYIILGHNWATIAHFIQKWLYLFITPYHAAKHEKILRADSEIKTFVILGNKWAKIAHFVQNMVFWEFH